MLLAKLTGRGNRINQDLIISLACHVGAIVYSLASSAISVAARTRAAPPRTATRTSCTETASQSFQDLQLAWIPMPGDTRASGQASECQLPG